MASLSVDKAAVRDRRKLLVVAHVAADAAPVLVAAGAVAVAVVAVAGAVAVVVAIAADGAPALAAAGAVAVAVAADGAPVPAAAGAVAAVAVVAALVDVAAVWRLQGHLAVVLAHPVKAVLAAAVSEAQRALGQASQAQVVELWSPFAAQRGAAPGL